MNCAADHNKLKAMILDCVQRYEGDHTACANGSCCRRQANYEPLLQKLQDDSQSACWLKLLTILLFIRKADLFIYNMSTAHLVSFNNPLNVVHDKPITLRHVDTTLVTWSNLCVIFLLGLHCKVCNFYNIISSLSFLYTFVFSSFLAINVKKIQIGTQTKL